eukprot:15707-Prymnesium_polylepis.1
MVSQPSVTHHAQPRAEPIDKGPPRRVHLGRIAAAWPQRLELLQQAAHRVAAREELAAVLGRQRRRQQQHCRRRRAHLRRKRGCRGGAR